MIFPRRGGWQSALFARDLSRASTTRSTWVSGQVPTYRADYHLPLQFFAIAFFLAEHAFSQPVTLDSYYQRLDYSCSSDSDCVVKDIGNCCGTYPRCVNKNAAPDKELVQRLCAEQGQMSICGFEPEPTCKCLEGQCKSETAALPPPPM